MNLAAILHLDSEPALIVGGGPVALRRAVTLKTAGLRVRVIAPDLLPELLALGFDCCQRAFEPADLAGMRIVVACTSSPVVNAEVTRLALALGALVNHAGEAGAGNLRFPAVLERGGVTVAISTGSELPMLAQALREKVALSLPEALPLPAWTAQRDAALSLGADARQAAMSDLRAEIRAAVGLGA
ncbi:precorrin-2 dehydrogenase/sirohydrochlorin ferrochelatase family protein [Deinococcus rubellus]|uniref:precorrin-2 dehydrogenase n=1 Tax=Deinococcus rubellus TaxID=1889240 RepID=A0ABY5YKS1_9DEIO|nr:bifunctional precorrin-2 dehydrogenase/sirohydrochlorin ferrochelatase [Deinococcus rubellus]UWX65413.1 bifunctional precorrin-2 dehydrogenase/sirohydrochlorin ferrochelatase [Deinococcus rubellus]